MAERPLLPAYAEPSKYITDQALERVYLAMRMAHDELMDPCEKLRIPSSAMIVLMGIALKALQPSENTLRDLKKAADEYFEEQRRIKEALEEQRAAEMRRDHQAALKRLKRAEKRRAQALEKLGTDPNAMVVLEEILEPRPKRSTPVLSIARDDVNEGGVDAPMFPDPTITLSPPPGTYATPSALLGDWWGTK